MHEPPRSLSSRPARISQSCPGHASRASGALWGLPNGRRRRPQPGVAASRCRRYGDLRPGRTCPSASRCGSRAATRSTSTPNSCAQLLAMQYADCFHRLSQIRVWNDGRPDNQVADRRRAPDRRLRQHGSPDAYFDTLPVAATDCRFGANVCTSTGATATTRATRTSPPTSPSGSTAPGAARRRSATRPTSSRTRSRGDALTASPGANDRHRAVDWDGQRQLAQLRRPVQRRQQPCKDSDTQPVHRRSSARRARQAQSRSSARRSRRGTAPAQPGPRYANQSRPAATGDALPDDRDPDGAQDRRLHDAPPRRPQANQTLRATRAVPRARNSRRSVNGCEPWYGENHFNGDVSARRTTRPRGGTRRPGVPRRRRSGSRTAIRARASASTRATTPGAAC